MKTKGLVLEPEVSRDVMPGAATLYDMSRWGANGAITGATWVRLPSGIWCLDFNAATPDYVTIPATATQLDFTVEDFSIIARVKLDGWLETEASIFVRSTWNAAGYGFGVMNNGRLYGATENGVEQLSYSPPGDIVINTWYTVGLSRIGASIRLIKDGVDTTNVPAMHIDPVAYAGVANIGLRHGGILRPWDGKIAFLRVFNYALSAGKHLTMHNMLESWV